jgi:hypothetical protein
MITEIINQQFAKMIGTSGIHRTLGITANHVKVLRHRIRHGQKISLDKKIKLLEKSGWDPGDRKWNDQDMIDLIKTCIRCSDAARQLGPGYILEKFKGGTR